MYIIITILSDGFNEVLTASVNFNRLVLSTQSSFFPGVSDQCGVPGEREGTMSGYQLRFCFSHVA